MDHQLTPFVTEQVTTQKYEGKKVDGMRYLKEWYKSNSGEVNEVNDEIAKQAAKNKGTKG